MKLAFRVGEQVHQVELERTLQGFRATLDGLVYQVRVLKSAAGEFQLQIDGRPLTAYWAVEGTRRWVSLNGQTFLLDKRISLAGASPGEADGEKRLRAPMPGQVRAVAVQPGDPVEKGQTLIILEAMKMEIRIQAPCAGRVARLPVAEGQTVERDQLLAEVMET